MTLYNIDQINELKGIVNRSKGEVWAEDSHGDMFDLKNELQQQMAIGELLNHPDNVLSFYASDINDQLVLGTFLCRTAHTAA